MESKGQTNGMEIIGLILILPIMLIFLVGIFNMIQASSGQPWLKQIEELNTLNAQLNDANAKGWAQADYWNNQYQNLKDTEITKEDFVKLNADFNSAIMQINLNTKNYYDMYQTFQNIEETYQTIQYFTLAISFEFALISITLIDIVFLNLKIINWIRKKLKIQQIYLVAPITEHSNHQKQEKHSENKANN